jgi:hypothetical protein
VQPTNRQHAYRTEHLSTAKEEAERRHAVKQRALELKRGLLESTLRLSPERAAAAYNEAARRARSAQRRGGPVLRLCLAVLGGALTMLVPVPSTCSLPGQLSAAAVSAGAATERRALVYAHPAQCERLSVNEPTWVNVETADAVGPRIQAQITRLAPRVGTADAPACQIELQLQARADQTTLLRELPSQAALVAVFSMQPTHWLAALADKAASDGTLRYASSMLRGYGALVWQRGLMLIDHVRHNANTQQHWENLRQIFAPEEQ